MRNLSFSRGSENLKWGVLFILLGACVLSLSAQGRSLLSGKVLSSDKSVIDFATVYLKGTQYGCTTNEKGLYHLKAPAGKYILTVSAIGFETVEKEVEILADGRSKQNVILKPSVTELDEVVVVSNGVGRIKRSAFNAVAVDTRELQNSTKNLSEALQKLPGMKLRGTPLVNPYWQYSRNKIEAEEVLMAAYRTNGFPVTIVRPSHTYNGTKPPVSVHGDKGNWQILKRILEGKPVIIPGDGSSLWTLTHSKDFAKGYVGLMANPHAIGNAFHITTDESMTWNQIYQTIADALGKPLNALHVASDFLAKHSDHYDFRGELLGDKAATVVFDNSKIKRLVPDFICNTSMADGLRQAVHYMLSHPESQIPDPEFDSWCDRIANAINAADKAFELS